MQLLSLMECSSLVAKVKGSNLDKETYNYLIKRQFYDDIQTYKIFKNPSSSVKIINLLNGQKNLRQINGK